MKHKIIAGNSLEMSQISKNCHLVRASCHSWRRLKNCRKASSACKNFALTIFKSRIAQKCENLFQNHFLLKLFAQSLII
jgi:hypothetical protein